MRYIIGSILLLLHLTLYSQNQGVSISPTAVPPHPSAALDVNFSDKGILPPRLTTAQRNAIIAPADGLVIFNTSTGCLNMYVAGGWRQSCFECDFGSIAITGNSTVCEGAMLSLQATLVPGASYQWTGPNGFSASTPSISIANSQANQSGVYAVTVQANNCSAPVVSTTVTIQPVPSTPNIVLANSVYCSGQPVQFSTATILGATYQWTGPAGFLSTAQNPQIASIQTNQAGVYAMSVSVNGCASPVDTQSVFVFAANGGMQAFNFTGNWQTFTVPPCVDTIEFKVWGAGGASGGNTGSGSTGGAGGYATGKRVVTPGQQFHILVGGGGLPDARSNCSAGGGGGFSGVFTNSVISVGNALIIAGGGGGSAGAFNAGGEGGGAGGGLTGQNGFIGSRGGSGGSQSSGGGAGVGRGGGFNGSAFQGGNGGENNMGSNGGYGGGGNSGCRNSDYGGGGGGGGFYGGGGGGSGGSSDGGGGGGGSSYLSSSLFAGQAIAGSGINAGNANDFDRGNAANAGVGGRAAGGNGRIVIRW